MKTTSALRAAAMLLSAGVGSAYAGNGNGQSLSSPATAIQAQLPSVSTGRSTADAPAVRHRRYPVSRVGSRRASL
jgi:hypothetical protein